MPALVAFDVPPATPPDLVAAVTASCSAALGEGSCVADRTQATRYVAVVRWSGAAGADLRVELCQGEVTLDTRVILFAPADRLRQRWASAGLVVAALVVQREAGEPPSPPPRVEEPDQDRPLEAASLSAEESVEVVETPASPRWLAVDLAGVVSPALGEGMVRGGTALRLTWAPSPLPLAPHLALRAVSHPGLPGVTWVVGDLGATVRAGAWDAPVSGELRASGSAERVFLVGRDPSSRVRDVAEVWRLGGRLGVEGGCVVHKPIGLFAGVEVALLRPELRIEVAGEPAGTDPPVGLSAWFGLRVLTTAPGGG